MSKKSQLPGIIRILSWGEIRKLTKNTFTEFFQEQSFFHGAALAYYTVFAMVPIIYLALISFGQFVGQERMLQIIDDLLKEQVGLSDSSGILSFLESTNFEKGSFIMNVIGVAALLLSSSAMLASLHYSINEFFDIHPSFEDRRKRIAHNIWARVINILFLPVFGLMLVLTYFGETVILSLSDSVFGDLSYVESVILSVLQHGLTLATNVLLFAFTFKFLHDGKVAWKLAFAGGMVTAFLLYLGQLVIKYYMKNYFFGSSVGVPGTILIILVWMYYSSQIIFLGAKFVKVYADMVGKTIIFTPRSYDFKKLTDAIKGIFNRNSPGSI